MDKDDMDEMDFLRDEIDDLKEKNAALRAEVEALNRRIKTIEYERKEMNQSFFNRAEKAESDLAAAVEVLRKYTKTGIARCENPIRERVLPTKFLEEWKLHDCGKCLYCNAVALLARMEVK